MTTTMYHTTPAEKVDSILESGLESRTLNARVVEQVSVPEFNHATRRVEGELKENVYETGVYLCSSQEHSERYADHLAVEHFWDDAEHEFAVLAVEVDREKVFADPELVNAGDHVTASGRVFVDDIPPEDVEVVGTVENASGANA